MQEELDLPVVNDGETRRESFQSELIAAFDGLTGVDVNAWLWGEWHSPEVSDLRIIQPEGLAAIAAVRKRRNLAAEEFTFCAAAPVGTAGRRAVIYRRIRVVAAWPPLVMVQRERPTVFLCSAPAR